MMWRHVQPLLRHASSSCVSVLSGQQQRQRGMHALLPNSKSESVVMRSGAPLSSILLLIALYRYPMSTLSGPCGLLRACNGTQLHSVARSLHTLLLCNSNKPLQLLNGGGRRQPRDRVYQ